MTSKNDCQRAFDRIAARPDATEIHTGPVPRIEIRRKIANPGDLSDGTRAFLVSPCERWRWLRVDFGWKTLVEIDQRPHFGRPDEIARLVMEAIDFACPTYGTELTPEGEQHVIPGCERNLSPKVQQLDLFG
jgi:hypothetical protein